MISITKIIMIDLFLFTRIISPIKIAFFLPILSRYLPIKGEKIRAESSKEL